MVMFFNRPAHTEAFDFWLISTSHKALHYNKCCRTVQDWIRLHRLFMTCVHILKPSLVYPKTTHLEPAEAVKKNLLQSKLCPPEISFEI